MRISTEFISEISGPTVFTSFDFHLFDFLVKGGRCVPFAYVLYCLDLFHTSLSMRHDAWS